MRTEQTRAEFEAWVSTQSVVTKYGAKLHRSSCGNHYKDLRINQRWLAFKAGQAALASPEVQALRKDAKTEQAVQRACKELPEGWEIHLEMERGAGCVSLYHHRFGIEFNDPYEGSASSINAAIDHARRVENRS